MSSLKPAIKSFSIVYFGLMIIMLVFGAFVFYVNSNGILSEDALTPEMSTIYRYLLIGLVPVGLVAGHFVYKNHLSKINPAATSREKFNRLQAAFLVRAACYEAPGLFGAVAAFKTGDSSFLLFTGIMLIVLFVFRPTATRVGEDLQLSEMEKLDLE